VLLGDERDSPRGRIYLIKDMFERGRDASDEVRHHVDRCLSCLSCMTTCPGGVDYMHLVDHARAHIHETGHRTLKDRALRSLLAAILPYPERFRMALKLVPFGQPFKGLMQRVGLKEMAAMLDLAPKSPLTKSATFEGPGTAATHGERRKRVLMLAGCAQQVLRPDINDATIRLLARSGVDVEVSAGAGCCGALTHHMGREQSAIQFAKANVDAWWKSMTKSPVDAIIINASGCGTTVKDYGHLLKHAGGDYAERAEKIASLTRDVTEFMTEFDLGPAQRWSSLRIAYHSACSMQHGQRITDEPKALLKRAGFSVVDIPEAHICCGSAGTYNILQPDIANELRARKVGNIKSVRPDIIAAGNLGCITQIGLGTDIPIIHTVELLDWAYGGPVPRGLEKYAKLTTDVPGSGQASNSKTVDSYITPQ
ncbi:MAG: glycolate oxidase subunit GlcF, partial [Hyphomicrobiaceae bacterium]|nr:glycolate oxidase subunit GlcF [Hyphomicrobiaceae bacterium]